MMDKTLFCVAVGTAGLFFILGWLFPIEGPYDYIYDNYIEEQKRPSRCCPAPAPKKTEIYEDYNEDGEPEWYEIVPLFPISTERSQYAE